MSSVTALRRTQPPPAQSPERLKLAEVIAERDAAATKLVKLRDALNHVGFIWRAEEVVDAARAAIEEAAKVDVRQSTAAAIADTKPPPPTVPAARSALQAAEDNLATIRATHSTLEGDITGLQEGARGHDIRVNEAIGRVLQVEGAPAVARLVSELDATHKRMVDLHGALAALFSAEGIAAIEGGRRDASDTPAGRVHVRYEQLPVRWGLALQHTERTTAAAWQAAIEALRTDASTPLPA